MKLFLLLVFSSFLLFGCVNNQPEPTPSLIACTEDAKICPDGSAVGRVPPSCEFAECPVVSCDYDSVDKKYVGFSQDECSRIKFLCVQGSEYFSDSCGCGCEYEKEPNRNYISRDLDECKTIQFLCVEGKYPFFSSTGCGCEVRKEAPDKCICTLQYDPVCGFDGNTYGNSCQAACAGVETNYSGECVAKQTLCTPDQRNVSGCTKELNPVCGWNDPEQIQCIKYPCAQNYDNPCLACTNEQVIGWTQGQCPVD